MDPKGGVNYPVDICEIYPMKSYPSYVLNINNELKWSELTSINVEMLNLNECMSVM